MSGNELKTMLGLPKEAKEDRAFGWPAGTVRAILCIALVVGFIAGVTVGLIWAGTDGAQVAGSILGPPAGGGTSYYFTQRQGK